MELADAEAMARRLLRAHGLTDRGWVFRFNRARRALGMCKYSPKRIELSRAFVELGDEAEVRDTILHEIAHALAGQKAGHGPKWRAECLRVGAEPKRLARGVPMPEGRWRAVCPCCHQSLHRHRRPQRGRTYFCRACGPTRGKVRFHLHEPEAEPVGV